MPVCTLLFLLLPSQILHSTIPLHLSPQISPRLEIFKSNIPSDHCRHSPPVTSHNFTLQSRPAITSNQKVFRFTPSLFSIEHYYVHLSWKKSQTSSLHSFSSTFRAVQYSALCPSLMGNSPSTSVFAVVSISKRDTDHTEPCR